MARNQVSKKSGSSLRVVVNERRIIDENIQLRVKKEKEIRRAATITGERGPPEKGVPGLKDA